MAHLSEPKGSNVSQPKADWMVAKSMLQKQLVVYYPVTKAERKIDSYSVVEGPRGTHWRDQLGIEYVAPQACKPLPGDFEAERMAKLTNTYIDLTMPQDMRSRMRELKKQTNLKMVRHIQKDGVHMVKPPEVNQLVEMARRLKAELQLPAATQNSDSEEKLTDAELPSITKIMEHGSL